MVAGAMMEEAVANEGAAGVVAMVPAAAEAAAAP
jgi:hypothetical protein